MVVRAGGYYGTGFKGERGVTQGDPLSPTIFNVVVDVVVHHWVTLAVTEAEMRGERGREGRHQAALFYTDDGMVASSDPRSPLRLCLLHRQRDPVADHRIHHHIEDGG